MIFYKIACRCTQLISVFTVHKVFAKNYHVKDHCFPQSRSHGEDDKPLPYKY